MNRERQDSGPSVSHQRAQDAFARVLANVTADQLGGSTPCSEWTINDLIEHVIGGNEYVGRCAYPDEELPGNLPERRVEHGGHPSRPREDVMSGGGSGPALGRKV